MAELQRLLLEAERPNVQNHLAQHLSKLTTELDNFKLLAASEAPQKQVAPPSIPVQSIDKTNFTPLTKYAWDQEGAKIKYNHF